jgi:hypothetical protein
MTGSTRRISIGFILMETDRGRMSHKTTRSELAQVFLSLLPDALKTYMTEDPQLVLHVPAMAAEVGDLTVHDDGKELTIYVGRIDHRHFEAYCETGSTRRERDERAAEKAMRWVQAIITDRVRFRNEFKAGRLIAGSSWYPERQEGGQLLKPTDEFREYTWSGEKLHEHRAID